MSTNTRYIVAGSKPWSRQVFDDVIAKYPGIWEFIDSPDELTSERINTTVPRFIFFLHWSWKVPSEIIHDYECICFHMTDVPYGRGGSPLQNLIVRGHRRTKMAALRMVEEFDAGPVYLKEDLCLEGAAEEIYVRGSKLSALMIRRIIEEQPMPQPQTGEPTFFKRRKPGESRIPELPSSEALYDFIRMLDAEGYPHAFLEYAGFRYEFTRAVLHGQEIVATVSVNRVEEPST